MKTAKKKIGDKLKKPAKDEGKTSKKKIVEEAAEKSVKKAKKAADAAVAQKGGFGKGDGTKKKAKAKPKKKFVYKTKNAELKPMFLALGFQTNKDGLLHGDPDTLILEAIKGSLSNDNAPRYNLFEHAPEVAAAIFTRLMYRTFAPNPDKRLPPETTYSVIIRLSVKRDDRSLTARVKSVSTLNAKGKMKEIEDKKDIAVKKLRQSGRFLAGAFTHIPDIIAMKDYQKELDASEPDDESDD